nr:hypothetical protein [Amanita phalloides]
MLYFIFFIYFDIFNIIYCDPTDEFYGSNFNTSSDSSSNSNSDSNSNKNMFSINKNQDSNNNNVYELQDKVSESALVTATNAIIKAIPNLGAAAAGGSLGSAIIKSTSGLPPLQIAALGIATAGLVKTSLHSVNKYTNNSEVKDNFINNEIIDKVKDNNQDNSEIVKEIIDKSVKCPLESGEINQLDISPLETLLSNILTFNILILFVIIIIIILLFNLIIFNKNSNLIILLVNKIFSDKLKFKKDIVDFLEKIVNKYNFFSKKYLVILIIINSFFLFWMLLFNIWITSELTNNIDDYVLVYNYLKQK